MTHLEPPGLYNGHDCEPALSVSAFLRGRETVLQTPTTHREERREKFYKLRPANKTDHLCQSWQYCHMFMKFRQSITQKKPHVKLVRLIRDYINLS